MPVEFSHEPPEDPRGNGLDLHRTPRGGALIAAITSVRIVGCATHFWGGRTVPCTTVNCEPHNHGCPWRWHGYVAAQNLKTGGQFLFEMTARASKPLTAWFDIYQTLRGCKMKATRHGNRINSQVHILTAGHDLIKTPLPDQPDVLACLSIIWNVPLDSLAIGPKVKNAPSIRFEDGLAERKARLEELRKSNGSPAAHQPDPCVGPTPDR